MIETFQHLATGFSLALQPWNLAYAFLGALAGTFVGVLPGIGPLTTIAVLLPLTYHTGSPLGALIMLAGIYYGAMYGGSTTSILLRIPGETASVVTCIDGYEMAKQGRAGPALAVAAIGSFIAGTLGVIGLTFVGPAFAKFGLSFGPPEFFALASFGLVLASTLSSAPLPGLCMTLLGVLLGLIGIDTVTGADRFSFGRVELTNGIDVVPMLMGVFGLAEILETLENKGASTFVTKSIGRLFLSHQDWKESTGPMLRGSVIGFVVGLLPGGGPLVSTLLSYGAEKRLSKRPERFGRGAIEGVAGPEAANNAAATASFIPLLTLGLPGNVVTAVLFAALLVQGIQPGPLLFAQRPDIFWGLIASMYVGNIMLLVLNLPLVGLWVQVLRLPVWILGPAVVVITVIGTYSLRTMFFDVGVLVVSGVFGYLFRKAGLSASPLAMAFILADILDTALRQSLLMGDGSPLILITRPISLTILAATALILLVQFSTLLRGMFARVAAEGEQA